MHARGVYARLGGRAASVEARRTRVGVHRRLRLRRGLEDGGPLALEEGELTHLNTPLPCAGRFASGLQRCY